VSDGTGDRGGEAQSEGLRERKKRQMRRLISATATEMFLERGFDEVRVTEVAERCGVSEKTVYNYFPTKESLVLDREEDMAVAIRAALGPGTPARSPTEAALEVLGEELEELRTNWDSRVRADGLLERFMELVEGTPSLRAAQRDMTDRLVQVAAEAMAMRAGVSPDDPEPQIAAAAIIGLWRIHYQAMRLYASGARSFDEVYEEVSAHVARAARLIDSGLWAFEVMVQGRGTREQMKAAAEAAQNAGRQVAAALRQARDLWRQVQAEHRTDLGPRGHGARSAGLRGEDLRGEGPYGAGVRGEGPYGAGRWGEAPYWAGRWAPGSRRSLDRQGQRNAFRREVEEWMAAQRELKQQYVKAKREQEKLLREALRKKQEETRRRGRPGAS
jgi:AcrR family transcriptional regulator